MDDDPLEPTPPPMTYGGLFLQFLRFGVLAFGGPVAQIAMIRQELVETQRWISGERFNRLLAVLQVLPGPEAHELCVHLGVRAKGRLGGLLAGLGFMLPGLVLMLGLAWLYFAIGVGGGALAAAFLGAQVAVLAVIARAAHRIGQHILVDRWLILIGAVCCLATLAGVTFWLLLPAAGVAYALLKLERRLLAAGVALLTAGLSVALVLTGSPDAASAHPAVTAQAMPGHAPASTLFLTGLKAGLLTFGGAYTAIPFMRSDIVPRGWVADGQFLDGVALAQVIPAPLIIFGTFVGYAAGGFAGALAMTAGVFLPAFGFSIVFYDRLETIVRTKGLRALLDGVAAGVVGLIAATTLQLGLVTAGAVPVLWAAAVILGLALVAVYAWKHRLAAPVIIGAGALAGFLVFR